jgi:hypothetical protein
MQAMRTGGCVCRCEVLPVGMILRRSSLKISGYILLDFGLVKQPLKVRVVFGY